MAVSFVNAEAAGGNTLTIPTHAVGDLNLAFAFRDGNTTPPSLPASNGWVSLSAATGASSCSARLFYKTADSTSEGFGTATNGTGVAVANYRSTTGKVLCVGAIIETGAASSTINYAALTPWNLFGNSWFVGFAGHRSVNQALETPPSGMTFRDGAVDATSEVAVHDSNGVLSSWSSQNVTGGGTSSGYRSFVVEIFEIDDAVAAAFSTTDKSATITISGTGNVVATNTGTVVNKAVRTNTCRLTGGHVIAFEYTTAATGNDMAFGFAVKSHPLTTRLEQATTAFAVDRNGNVTANSSIIASLSSFVQGDTIYWAFKDGLNWIKVNSGDWNNSGSADPDAGTGGFATPAALLGQPLFPIAGFWNSDGVWTMDPAATGHGLTTFDTWEAVSSGTDYPASWGLASSAAQDGAAAMAGGAVSALAISAALGWALLASRFTGSSLAAAAVQTGTGQSSVAQAGALAAGGALDGSGALGGLRSATMDGSAALDSALGTGGARSVDMGATADTSSSLGLGGARSVDLGAGAALAGAPKTDGALLFTLPAGAVVGGSLQAAFAAAWSLAAGALTVGSGARATDASTTLGGAAGASGTTSGELGSTALVAAAALSGSQSAALLTGGAVMASAALGGAVQRATDASGSVAASGGLVALANAGRTAAAALAAQGAAVASAQADRTATATLGAQPALAAPAGLLQRFVAVVLDALAAFTGRGVGEEIPAPTPADRIADADPLSRAVSGASPPRNVFARTLGRVINPGRRR